MSDRDPPRPRGVRQRLREVSLAACIGVAAGGCGSAATAEDIAGARQAVDFDIGGQPLASALDAYSTATGLQVVYDGALALGLHSRPVVGAMSPEAALRALLDGTGLMAVYAPDAFTIVPAPAAPSRPAVTLDGFMPYLAAVQGRVEHAFCDQPVTRPGGYRIRFRFWIGPGGEVLRPQLLGSSSDGGRDQAIMRTLGGLRIDRPPPPGMPQPVVMAIASRSPADTGDCMPAAPGSAIAGRR